MRKLRLPINACTHLLHSYFAPQIRAAAVNVCCKFLFGNAYVLYGNAFQAASPALTACGAESRPCSSPPTTLKLAFLYGNAFLQQTSTAARFLCASYACPLTLAHICSTHTSLRRYVQQPLMSAANSSLVTLMSSTVTLSKLQARLSQPVAQRADLAAAHPPP